MRRVVACDSQVLIWVELSGTSEVAVRRYVTYVLCTWLLMSQQIGNVVRTADVCKSHDFMSPESTTSTFGQATCSYPALTYRTSFLPKELETSDEECGCWVYSILVFGGLRLFWSLAGYSQVKLCGYD